MGGFSLSGFGGGLDVAGIVQQLMFLESEPIRAIEREKDQVQFKINAYNELNTKLSALSSKLSALNDSDNFGAREAASSEESILTASATSEALQGVYQIQVNRLALFDNFVSDATFSATDDAIGTGSFDLSIGADSETITIDSSNNTLTGLRDAINNSELDVRANIINDGTGYRLTLTSEDSGSASAIGISNNTLTLSGGGALDFSRTHTIADVSELDASLNVNGLNVTSSTNQVTEVLPGVTLQLKSTSASNVNLTVSNDTETVKNSVGEFVEAYNDVYSYINSQFTYSEVAETSGVLAGENLLRTIQSQLASSVKGSVNTSNSEVSTLYGAGIKLQNDGTLQVDDTRLNEVLEDHFKDFETLFLANASATDAAVNYLSHGPNTVGGSYQVDITALATAAELTSPNSFNKLNADETLTITAGGVNSTVFLPDNTNRSDVVDILNAAFIADGNPVTASESGNQLLFTAHNTGSDQSLTIVSDLNSGGTGFGTTGLSASGTDLMGTFTDTETGTVYAASGQGNILTGTEGNTEGLKVQFTGSTTGTFGTVDLTVGFAEQLELTVQSLTDSLEGPIHLTVERLEASIRGLDENIRDMEERLALRERSLFDQFTRADQALSQLSFLQNSLGQQLAQLG